MLGMTPLCLMRINNQHVPCAACRGLSVACVFAGPSTDVAFEFLRSPLAFIDSLTQQYGPTIGLKLGGEHVVLTGDPEISRQVLIDQASVFVKVSCNAPHIAHKRAEACLLSKRGFLSHLNYRRHFSGIALPSQEGTAFFPGSSLAGNGLLVSDGATWQRQRQLSNPAFRSSVIKTYAGVRSLSGVSEAVLCMTHCVQGRICLTTP